MFSPSIVPADSATLYLVEDDYGRVGRSLLAREMTDPVKQRGFRKIVVDLRKMLPDKPQDRARALTNYLCDL